MRFLVSCLWVMNAMALGQDFFRDWEGTLKVSTQLQLRIVVHISQDKEGIQATLDSPDQGVTGIPVSSIEIKGRTIHFASQAIGATYDGELQNGMIRGTFTQAGQARPLDLVIQTKEHQERSRLKRPQTPMPPFPYRVEDVRFPNPVAGIQLAGTLTLPKGKGPFPCAILLSGTGPQDRDETLLGHKPFAVIADHLTRQGVAVLRFDDRGFGQSEGDFAAATLEDFSEDAQSAFDYLTTRPDIQEKHIGFIGHSEGGMVAPMAAAGRPLAGFIVLLAGVAVDGQRLWAEQQRDLAALAGGDGDFAYVQQKKAAGLVIGGASKSQLEVFFATEMGMNQQTTNAYVRLLASPWGPSFMGYKPETYFSLLKMPILALNGKKDIQVNAQSNLENLERILTKYHHPDYKIEALDDLNHLFQRCKTGGMTEYGQLEETFNQAALETMTSWIRSKVK